MKWCRREQRPLTGDKKVWNQTQICPLSRHLKLRQFTTLLLFPEVRNCEGVPKPLQAWGLLWKQDRLEGSRESSDTWKCWESSWQDSYLPWSMLIWIHSHRISGTGSPPHPWHSGMNSLGLIPCTSPDLFCTFLSQHILTFPRLPKTPFLVCFFFSFCTHQLPC